MLNIGQIILILKIQLFDGVMNCIQFIDSLDYLLLMETK